MDGISIDPKFRAIIPPLTSEELAGLTAGRLGLSGTSTEPVRGAKLIPTSMSPHYWIWTLLDLSSGTEEYSSRPTACSRIPWDKFRGMQFKAIPMEQMWEYPPTAEKVECADYLYIIQPIYGGPVKIGRSHEPESRIAQLQPGNPYPLRLIRVYRGRGGSETAIHASIKEMNYQGEWFHEDAVEIVDEMMVENLHSARKATS